MSGVDLTEFDGAARIQEEGVVVELLHPATGEPLGASIRIAGPDSAPARRADRDLIERRSLAHGRVRRLTPDQLQEETVRKMAARTMSWEGVVDGGEPIECTTEAAMQVYQRAPWILDQVVEVAGDRAAFFRGRNGGAD